MDIQPSYVIGWFNVSVCLPLTVGVIFCLCRKLQSDSVPVYYINLLVADLIQICALMFLVKKKVGDNVPNEYTRIAVRVTCGSLLAVLSFRMMIALERSLFITRPGLSCIRQTRGHVAVSVMIWFCSTGATALEFFFSLSFELISSLLLLFSLVLIYALVATLCRHRAATSVSVVEKRRIVLTLVMLMLQHILIIMPFISFCIAYATANLFSTSHITSVFLCIFMLIPFVDLLLCVVMLGLVDKVLSGLCCCRMEGSESDRSESDRPESDHNKSLLI